MLVKPGHNLVAPVSGQRTSGDSCGHKPGPFHVQAHEGLSLCQTGDLSGPLTPFPVPPSWSHVPEFSLLNLDCLPSSPSSHLLSPVPTAAIASQLVGPPLCPISPVSYLGNNLPKDHLYLRCFVFFQVLGKGQESFAPAPCASYRPQLLPVLLGEKLIW